VARKPRFNLSGIPQHVIQRGNNREPCFFAEQDYRRYLADLKENRGQITVFANIPAPVFLTLTGRPQGGGSWRASPASISPGSRSMPQGGGSWRASPASISPGSRSM